MRFKIAQFLKEFGLRTAPELLKPRLHAVKKLELPMEAVYHFFDDNGAVIGPSQTDPLLARLNGKVFIEHKTVLDSLEGNARRTSVIPASLEATFRRQNRFFKPLRKDEAVKLNAQNVALFNYNMLNPLYKYMANYKSTWFRWVNNSVTFWDGVTDAYKRFPQWNHFIELAVPSTMPTISAFKLLTTSQTQAGLETFNTTALLNLFDLYRFFGEEREQSFINKLPKEAYAQINFFVRVQGSFFVMNLGKLEEWRNSKPVEEELVDGVLAQESYIDALGLEAYFDPAVMQRRVVSLFASLVEYAHGNDTLIESDDAPAPLLQALSEPEDVVPVEEENEESDRNEENERTVDDEQVTEINAVDDTGKVEGNLVKTFDLDIVEATYVPPPETGFDATTLVIEKDIDPVLQARDKEKVLNVNTSKARAIENDFTTGDDLADGVAKRAYDLYSVSMISPNTFEKAIDDAMTYQVMPDPFGSGLTVAEAMVYKPEDLTIPETKFADKSTITDKSMLRAKHKAMMRKYNKDLLPKDVLNSIMAVQYQGVAVTDIRIEEIEDAMNHFQSYSVTVKPIRGRSSVLRFRLPVIDRDGRFKANGVTYRQRLQRADFKKCIMA